jgi:citrate synthase
MSAHARASRLVGQLVPPPSSRALTVVETANAKKETITVTDNRSGKSVEIEVKYCVMGEAVIDSQKFWDVGKLRLYDPGFMNTTSATSRITWIDGDKGILLYRGIPVEQLAAKSTFLEVSYLLLYGELPSKSQLSYFFNRVMRHTFVHEDLKEMMKSFRYNAHPMGMLVSSVAAMSTFHPEANPALSGQNVYDSKALRNKQIHRLLGNMPTIAAYSYRHRIGRPLVDPIEGLNYTENFLYMMDKLGHINYRPHPTLARALDILFILHADHELNCSTQAMRHLASSGVDVYTCVAGSCGALYGPRHGGANEAVLNMLEEIGSIENIPAFVEKIKTKEHGAKLMGFGHRVYKNYDPRAKIVRELANEVFEVVGREPLIEVATALEKIALSDEYFIKRKLYPNVDFYSGLIYKAMGFPSDFFTVLFAIPRTVGWLAHWYEFLDDKENKIVRPRQFYVGKTAADYVEIERRTEVGHPDLVSAASAESKRRNLGGDS